MPLPFPLPQCPRLLSVATAVPRRILHRDDVIATAGRIFADASEMSRMRPIYLNAGGEQRHSSVPLEWYLQPHGWAERNRLFAKEALELMELAARRCLRNAGLGAENVDVVITVSSTGIATPSLDALLIERMRLRPDTIRLPVFGPGFTVGFVLVQAA